MLSKKQFLDRLNFIIEYDKKTNNFDQALRTFAHSDFTGYYDEDLHLHLLKMLAEDMEQDEKDDLISWWLYDCPEAGAKPEHAKIWDGDKDDPNTTEYDVSTPEKLYDYIFIQKHKAPSEDVLRLTIKSQDNGFKFALKHLDDLKQMNKDTKNHGWEDRDSLFDFIIKTLKNDYLYARGTKADLNYKDNLYIISLLDEES